MVQEQSRATEEAFLKAIHKSSANKRETWPNFFIVGAMRAGTTSLYECLKRLPGIYMSPIKEPHYFATKIRSNPIYVWVKEKREYLKLFSKVNSEVAIGEASPSYLWDTDSPGRIKNASPNARAIILLRDPVERAFSHYLFSRSYGWEKLPFYEALTEDYYGTAEKAWGVSHLYVEFGLYSEQVKRYFDTFGRDRVKVLIFEEFVKNPERRVNEVLDFLGVEISVRHKLNAVHNAYSVPRTGISPSVAKILSTLASSSIEGNKALHQFPLPVSEAIKKGLFKDGSSRKPEIPKDGRKFLEEVYRGDVKTLEQFLDRDLPWPAFS